FHLGLISPGPVAVAADRHSHPRCAATSVFLTISCAILQRSSVSTLQRPDPCAPIHFDPGGIDRFFRDTEFDQDRFFRIRWRKSAYQLGRKSHETSYCRCVTAACLVCRSSNRKEA